MSCSRALLCLLPPFAVLDRGVGTLVLVIILTILGYFPGVIAALIINSSAANSDKQLREIKKLNRK